MRSAHSERYRLGLLAACAVWTLGCQREKWAETSEPTGGDLRAMWGSSATDIWATGRDGAAAHWDGAQWHAVKLPTATDVVGVWGSSAKDVWAVGGGSASGHAPSGCALMHFDGATWESRSCPPGSETSALLAVHGAAPNDVWAVGVGPIAMHWDGNRWATSAVPPRDGRLTGVFVTGPRDVWTVGRSTVLHYDGASWSVAQSNAQGLAGIWGLAPGNVWAFGGAAAQPSLLHFDGAAWATVACPATGGAEPIEAAWGAREEEVFFVQADGDVYRANERGCAALRKPGLRRAHAIWGTGDAFWVAGEDGRIAQHLPR